MYLLFFLTIALLTNSICGQNNTVETNSDCDVSELQIDSFQLSAFVHNYAESGTISDTAFQDIIFLPKKVYDTAMYLLSAQKYSDTHYGVLCTGTYPDLIFTILGRELHVPQKYYVDQNVRDNNQCKILLDYKSDTQSYEFPQKFTKNICRLLNN